MTVKRMTRMLCLCFRLSGGDEEDYNVAGLS